MNRKTMEGWRRADTTFGAYCPVGSRVDEAIVHHFRDCVFPAHMDSRMVQCGEPYAHVGGRPTFATFVLDGLGWRYCGHCYLRETTEPGAVKP